jgi:hypothetical protein
LVRGLALLGVLLPITIWRLANEERLLDQRVI